MNKTSITGIILAGGQGQRMNECDKGLVPFKAVPLYQHSLTQLAPQVGQLMINANRHLDIYARSGYPIITDTLPGFQGPLAGILCGLLTSQTPWTVFVPCDTPFIPSDLVLRLSQSIKQHTAAVVCEGIHTHSTHLLLHQRALAPLENYLKQGQRKIALFLSQIDTVPVDFSDCPACFENINTLAERDFWERQ